MRIAYLITRADPIGGAQIHVRDLALALRAAGHDPAVITSGRGPIIEHLRAAEIPVHVLRHLTAPIRPLRDLLALREVHAVLADLRPDLLAAHSSKAGFIGRLAARSLGIPVIFTVHGWAFTPGVPSLQAAAYLQVERLMAPLASRIITVSDFDRRLAMNAHLGRQGQITTVHNGMPDVAPGLRADPSASPPKMIMIARLEPQKDHETLLQALGGLREVPWELDLVGDGPLMGAMMELAEAQGIAGRVRFLGQRTDVPQLLAGAQIGLLITNWEGFPRSILEAMRAGLPVVASSVGGISESVRDGETGFLVPRGGVAALRSRIEQLLSSPALRTQMGARSRTRYEQEFSFDRMVGKTLSVYREVLAAHVGSDQWTSDSNTAHRPGTGLRQVGT